MRIAPAYEDARRNLAAALLKVGRLPEAIAQFAEILRLEPGRAEAHKDLALALDKAGRLPEAVAEYKEALRVTPATRRSITISAMSICEGGGSPRQSRSSRRLSGSGPAMPGRRDNLGGALLETGRPQEAIVQSQEALRLKPELVEARVNLGSAFLRDKPAGGECDRLVSRGPAHPPRLRGRPSRSGRCPALGGALRGGRRGGWITWASQLEAGR